MLLSTKETLTYRKLLETLRHDRGMHDAEIAWNLDRGRYIGLGETEALNFVQAVRKALQYMVDAGLARRIEETPPLWVRTQAGTDALKIRKLRRR